MTPLPNAPVSSRAGYPKPPVPTWAVFLFFACLYTLCIGRGFYSSDGEVMFKTTAALVEHHSFALEPDPGLPQIVRGHDGAYYSKYDPGLPLLLAPFYVTGDWIAEVNHAHRYRLAATFVLLVPALAAAATLVTLSRIATLLDESCHPGPLMALPRHSRVVHGPAMPVILAAGLASPIWYYARVLFAETILALTLTVTTLIVLRSDQNPRRRASARCLLLAGAAFGLGLLTRAALIIYLPAVIVLIMRQRDSLENRRTFHYRGHREHRDSLKEKREKNMVSIPCDAAPSSLSSSSENDLSVFSVVKTSFPRVLAFSAGLLPLVAVLLWHNALRFDNPLQFGYAGEGFTTPPWEGIAGLLFSPGKSVFLYAPPLILSAILWPRFRRTYPALGEFLALAWISALIFYGAWWAWHGGWSWGPRFLVSLIPLSSLPLVMLPRARLWRGIAGVLILAGIIVQGAGVLTDLTPHYVEWTQNGETDYAALHGDPRHAPQVAALRRVLHGQTEPLAVFHLKETGLPPTWSVGVPLLLVIGLLTPILIAWQRRQGAN